MPRFARCAALGAALSLTVLPALAASDASESPDETLSALIVGASEIETPTQSAAQYAAAATSYRGILEQLGTVDREALGPSDEIDAELLEAHERTRLFEIEELGLHRVVPVQSLALSETIGLFLRPCGASDRQLDGAKAKVAQAAAGIRAGDFEATPGYPACDWCPYRRICPAAP